MKGPKLTVALVVCLVCLAIAPIATAEEALQEPEPAAEPADSVAPAVCVTPSEALEIPEDSLFLAAGSCSATADCWDGSHVTCTASGSSASCSFTDSDCDNNVRGHCWSSDEGTKYCPRCPCEAPDCSLYEGRKCKPGTQSPECNTFGICAHCFCTSSGIYICP